MILSCWHVFTYCHKRFQIARIYNSFMELRKKRNKFEELRNYKILQPQCQILRTYYKAYRKVSTLSPRIIKIFFPFFFFYFKWCREMPTFVIYGVARHFVFILKIEMTTLVGVTTTRTKCLLTVLYNFFNSRILIAATEGGWWYRCSVQLWRMIKCCF